jgi:hypothetical protein
MRNYVCSCIGGIDRILRGIPEESREVQLAADKATLEYWIPAEDLERFNDHIIGKIEVIGGVARDNGSLPRRVEKFATG